MKITAVSPEPNPPDTAANLKDAAEKFEALLIAQILKSAREADSGGWSGSSDQSTSTAMEMAEQHLAELLGSQGALGLANMVVNQLGKKSSVIDRPAAHTSAKLL